MSLEEVRYDGDGLWVILIQLGPPGWLLRLAVLVIEAVCERGHVIFIWVTDFEFKDSSLITYANYHQVTVIGNMAFDSAFSAEFLCDYQEKNFDWEIKIKLHFAQRLYR